MWQARPSGVGKRGHPGQELERAGLPLLHKSPQRSWKNADSDSEGLGWGPKFCIFTNSQVTCCCCSGDQFRRFCGPTKGMEEWMWVRVGRERRARNIRAGLGRGELYSGCAEAMPGRWLPGAADRRHLSNEAARSPECTHCLFRIHSLSAPLPLQRAGTHRLLSPHSYPWELSLFRLSWLDKSITIRPPPLVFSNSPNEISTYVPRHNPP